MDGSGRSADTTAEARDRDVLLERVELLEEENTRLRSRLREREAGDGELLQKMMEIETVGIIFFDPSGDIVEANDAFLRMGGYTREELEARELRWDRLTPPEHMDASRRAIEQLMTDGSTRPYEKEYYTRDGGTFWGLFAAKGLSSDRGVEFILDITAEKEAQAERLRLYEEARAARAEAEEARAEAEDAARTREARSAARASLARSVEEAESEVRELEERARGLELELRRLDADEAARSGQRARTERSLDELEQRAAGLRAAAEQARAEAAAAEDEAEELAERLETLQGRRQEADEALASRQHAWEEVRDEVSELRVAHAREEAALAELERRRSSAESSRSHAETRLGTLDTEEADHERTLAQLREVREEGGAVLESLFDQRSEAAERLHGFDERLREASGIVDELERRARKLRSIAESSGEERHTLELRMAEAAAAERRIRERLEVEWDRPFEQLVEGVEPVEGELEPLKAELQQLVHDIDRLGPINMLAMEEYEEEKERLDFLHAQRDDLVAARDDLQKAIREINRTARQLFLDTFNKVRANFQKTFKTLFEGGQCDVWLADEEEPLESPIEISASPRGKRTQRIHLLSGGERALTSLALLFAIYLVKPSPFCVLDEVDAPLDEANIGRFLGMLDRFKADTQFIVVTHNPRTMEAADWIYGVTMEEPGVSSIVGVQLDDAVEAAGAA